MFIIVLDVKKFNILFSCVKTFGLQTKYCSLTYLQKHECEMDGYCISLRYGDETLPNAKRKQYPSIYIIGLFYFVKTIANTFLMC